MWGKWKFPAREIWLKYSIISTPNEVINSTRLNLDVNSAVAMPCLSFIDPSWDALTLNEWLQFSFYQGLDSIVLILSFM